MRIRDNRFRLQQWQLAERQRYLDELESLAARLRGDVRRLGNEIDAAAGDPLAEVTGVRRLFVAPLIDRRDKLTRSIAVVDAQIRETREVIAAGRHEARHFGDATTVGGAPPRQRRRRRDT